MNRAAIKATINDTVRYCITEPVTVSLIDGFWSNKANEATIIELDNEVSHWHGLADELENKVEQLEMVSAEKDTIIEVADESTELSKKDNRKLKLKIVANWFKSVGGQLAVGATGLGIGIGVGYILKNQ